MVKVTSFHQTFNYSQLDGNMNLSPGESDEDKESEAVGNSRVLESRTAEIS